MGRILLRYVFYFIVALLIYLNARLYYQPKWAKDQLHLNQSIYAQLQHLQMRMHTGAGADMQNVFPEGFLFLNALYGLSWCALLEKIEAQSAIQQQGLDEVRWALQEIASPVGKRPFNPNLPLAYGAYYMGWSNYLRGKYLTIIPASARDSAEVKVFQNNCALIASAVQKSETPFLESYIYAAWPADMVLCMATLALHDRLFEPRFRQVLNSWVERVEQKTDALGLIPHSVHPYTGSVIEPARGSSQSLILSFLIEIDSNYARQKFKTYKQSFLAHRFGLPGIREYPKGTLGLGDIDSGPVLLGIGGAASIVGQRTMALYGENDTSIGLRNSIEAFGVGLKWRGKKRYIFGTLPIADAFIAWCNSVEAVESDRLVEKRNWRWGFQLGSVVVVIMGLIGLRIHRNRKF